MEVSPTDFEHSGDSPVSNRTYQYRSVPVYHTLRYVILGPFNSPYPNRLPVRDVRLLSRRVLLDEVDYPVALDNSINHFEQLGESI
jgi:hypothetical protein